MLDMDSHEIEQMLSDARIGRLCMADRDGRPYALPFPFCWLNDSLYIRLPLSGRKGAVLAANNHVCFEIDHCTDDLSDYASVLIEGRLVPVTCADERLRVKQANDLKYHRLRGGFRPGHGRVTPLEALPIQKICVERLSGRKKDPDRVNSRQAVQPIL